MSRRPLTIDDLEPGDTIEFPHEDVMYSVVGKSGGFPDYATLELLNLGTGKKHSYTPVGLVPIDGCNLYLSGEP